MDTEYLVLHSVVARLTIRGVAGQERAKTLMSQFSDLSKTLQAICQPPRDKVIVFDRRGYYPVYAGSDDLASGCSWTEAGEVGGIGQVVLSPVGQSLARVRVRVKLVVAKNDKTARLIVEHDPTTMTIGMNYHPAAFIDPATEQPVFCPSSNWLAMGRAFRLGLEFLAVVAKRNLFDKFTLRAIARGDFDLVRVQWAAWKPVKSAPQFLQLLTVVYDPRIARGSGIISNATHLGLEFDPRINRDTHRLDGVRIRKFHGNKLVFSVRFRLDDEEVRLDRPNSSVDYLLTEAQAMMVKQSVREEITVCPEGIEIFVEKAQRTLKSWGEEGLKFFDFLSPEIFLSEEPQATLWGLQRSAYILSHQRRGGGLTRFSFGSWLVPYIETDVLRFDVIAGITAEGFHQVCGLSDPVAVAWRSDKVASRNSWAARLAKAAKVSEATVYNRRVLWWDNFRIDIMFPLQLYSDILQFGQASTTKPENITKLLAAVQNDDAEAVLGLYAEALADFEHKRLTVLNPALLVRPRPLPLEGPPGVRPDLDVDGDAMEDGDLSGVDPLEADSVSDPEASGPLPSEGTKPSAALGKMASPLRKKSMKLKVAPSKFGRLRRRHDS
jgi:hypothetical protein